jgi:putative NIF3 family GTP cyclohydrolase 1 type 2
MDDDLLSRRKLMLSGAALAAASTARPQQPTAKLTAADIVERIRNNVGIPWRAETVDKIVAGAADTVVTGVATTMMATLDVLQRAAASGMNLVITHETPFYLHQDQTADLTDDSTFQYKMNFIREHGMVVFHFHDHWHARKPDGIATGMTQELGWTHNADPQNPRRFTFPAIPLERFAKQIESRLKVRTMRVVGDPKLPVRRVLTSWGYVSRMPGIPQFRVADVDVFIAGETREWELVEYVQDSITKGDKKALILLGHVVSEQAGMKYCAEWLRAFVPMLPIAFVAAREPFWSLNHPTV